jgi:hypothetical protein
MRFLGCVFALLLLSAPAPSLAGEASAPLASSASILPFGADHPSLCLQDASRLPALTEQSLPPSPAAFVPRRCGICSSVECRGVTIDGSCYNGGPIALVCLNAGYVCPADGSVQCVCGGPM